MNTTKYENAHFISLNVRGINNRKKRLSIFRFLKKEKCDICFLQETYSAKENEIEWSDDWGGQCLFSHGRKHSRGVMILIRQGLECTTSDLNIDLHGRYIICKADTFLQNLMFVNIYAPTNETEQHRFFENLYRILNHYEKDTYFIIRGDWNVTLNPFLDKQGGNQNYKSKIREQVQNIIAIYDLYDVWRRLHPKKLRFSWRQKLLNKHSRLDYFLISNLLQDNVEKSSFLPATLSDHSPISLILKFAPKAKGSGIWKLNTSLLKDDNYVEELSRLLELWKEELTDHKNKTFIWDYLKYNIRKYSISYSKSKKKELNVKEFELKNRLQEIEDKLSSESDDNLWLDYEKIKYELNDLIENKIQGIITRARIKWTEENERNSAYFFGLEKSNYIKRNINKIIIEDCETNNQDIILKSLKDYYKDLYSEKNNTLNKTNKENEFLTQESIPKLSENETETCEGPIRIQDMLNTIRLFKQNKTPVNDGLPVEFYIQFWQSSKFSLLECVIYAYENGLMNVSQRQAVISLLDKPGKNRMYINNWRPISLLNCDYKIMSKCIAERFKRILPIIIHENQVGFVKGRNISEAIRTIIDILDDTAKRNLSGILLTIDFEKAFDTLDWTFLENTLTAFNFGKSAIRWVKLFYNDISSCVINNNVTTPF